MATFDISLLPGICYFTVINVWNANSWRSEPPGLLLHHYYAAVACTSAITIVLDMWRCFCQCLYAHFNLYHFVLSLIVVDVILFLLITKRWRTLKHGCSTVTLLNILSCLGWNMQLGLPDFIWWLQEQKLTYKTYLRLLKYHVRLQPCNSWIIFQLLNKGLLLFYMDIFGGDLELKIRYNIYQKCVERRHIDKWIQIGLQRNFH